MIKWAFSLRGPRNTGQERGGAASGVQSGPLCPRARGTGEGQRVGANFKLWAQSGWGKEDPRGRHLGAEGGARREGCQANSQSWGRGAGRGGQSGQCPPSECLVSWGSGKQASSSSKVNQTDLPILPGSRSPSGKLFALFHQTLRSAWLPPGEVAAREGLSSPVPADSQLIGP